MIMTTADKAKLVYALVNKAEQQAHQVYTDNKIEHAGLIAMRDSWQNEHKDDIGFSVNPFAYKAECSAKRVIETYDQWHNLRKTLEFANDHFLSMIPDEQ
jgi:hypothetical protein